MPADPTGPGRPDGHARFRADLAAYLDSLPITELAELLGDLPSSRPEPLRLGVLMVAMNERLPDAYKLLPPAGQPDPGEGRRRSLRELVADRRAARDARRARPAPPGLADWRATRQQQAAQNTDRRHGGVVAERRVAETLRAWVTDDHPAAGSQHHSDQGELPNRSRRPGEERGSDREDR